ncbi:MAG: 2-oxoglutarate dehydrogenase complex dihydrolipoyllysine-residue succinyltransferase [Alphaproteobacteria bacterium]|nr:2-oxoglutarate dehydrogenase complex dihydrolipoyllysine-residue succinyltransferase [Alphaproteobacteria bacterium]
MTTEIRVPTLGESITEATVAKWLKAVGDHVAADEPLVELETDKVTVEVPASVNGTLTQIMADVGVNVAVGAIIGVIQPGAGKVALAPRPQAARPAPALAARPAPAAAPLSPAVRRLVSEHQLAPRVILATGKDGRLTKGDVLTFIEGKGEAPAAVGTGRAERRVRMTRLRKRIAERLKEAQNTAAMLTTFNEVDMTAVLAARDRYRDRFEKRHGVRLGFMSFFVKAAIVALKEVPAVNAQIEGEEVVYKDYYDIGVAVGTAQGLVVPILRDADRLGFAEIEKAIAEFGHRARDGKLTLDDLTGGTFTISNGGVYGSLLSTPILNPPQSGILGMHKIQPRPIAVGDKVEIRPMMYLAVSYDHRIIDGSEAVTFLVRLKECIEDPQRILFDM